MSVVAFEYGDGVIVTAKGPGKVHLISYASNASIQNHVGYISTNSDTANNDVTRFIISHSYTFTKFSFYWEGSGEAVCGIGNWLSRIPVETSWSKATTISYGGSSFGTADVTAEVNKGVKRDNEVTCFIIPDRLL